MKVRPIFLILTLAALSLPLSAEQTGILGTWRSAELNTGSTLQVAFAEEKGAIVMKLWSSTGGGISDHAKVHQTELAPEKAKSLSIGESALKIPIHFGFKETLYEVSKTDAGLRLDAIHEYTDDSGRETRTETLNFVPGHYRDALAAGLGDGVPEEGWLGVWKNRDTGTRGIAQLLIQDTGEVMMSTWGIAGGGLSPKRGSYVKLPLDGDSAHSMDKQPEIKATFDHGWAHETYTMELHEDGINLISNMKYHDARGERSYEYEFVRGLWED